MNPARTLPLPSRALLTLLVGLGAVLCALGFTGTPVALAARGAALAVSLLAAALAADYALSLRRWRAHPLQARLQLPRAFAVAVPTRVSLTLENPAPAARRGWLFQLADPSVALPQMPLAFEVPARQSLCLQFELRAGERGTRRFGATQLRLRSNFGLLDLDLLTGEAPTRRVFPNFRLQAAFEWLTGNQRLAEMGIKSFAQRGAATDFDELAEYRAGDAIRHIDWKASARHQRPIVRRYQDERDQSVMFLLDCGRRMRADDRQGGAGTTHFDQALNALMLLAFVALSRGDAVGAMTFGTRTEDARRFAPRKGRASLNALMAELGDAQPAFEYSDYVAAAADCVARHRKRGLLVLITNCREEDGAELRRALTLLRDRHLVVLASLREEVIGQLSEQPVADASQALEAAAALEYAQRRRDALRRLSLAGVMLIDCEPAQLGVQLVNRYLALKRTGAI